MSTMYIIIIEKKYVVLLTQHFWVFWIRLPSMYGKLYLVS